MPDEVLSDLLERYPLHAAMRGDVLDDPLEHEQDLRAPGHVGMDRDRERRVVHLAIDPVELVTPDLFEVPRVDEAVAIGRGFDEHHWREIVEVPATGDLDEIGHLATLERLHPMRRRL